MNTNPNAITVLCFGDSNTNGATPDKSGRFAANVRWVGQLQTILGPNYYVIEEGLGGRTTNSDHFREGKEGRNGFVYFKPALESHLPLNYLVIMLGTNDVKNIYNKSVDEIATALGDYVKFTRDKSAERGYDAPKVILVSPAPVDKRSFGDVYDQSSVDKSLQLAGSINKLASQLNCEFVDASTIAEVGADGIHLTKDSQSRLAQAIARKLH